MPDSTINDLTAISGANVDVTNDSLPIWTSARTRKITPGQLATALGQTTGIVSVKEPRFGAVGDGVTDDAVAFGLFYDRLETNGGLGLIPPATYLLSSQQTLTITGSTPSIQIIAYGATLTTSGAISAFKVTGSNVPQIITVYGLNVNAVASQTAGFEATGTAILHLVDCTVEGVAASAGYIGFWLHQTTAGDANTACFWSKLHRCNVRDNAGDIAHGIKIQGACNATHIMGGTLSVGVGNCVTITNESGASDGANGVVIDGVAFEGFTLGVSCEVAAAGTTSGLRIVNCRAEDGTTFFSMTGSTTAHAVPPFLAGNYLVSNVTNYIANTNSIEINSWDFSITPTLNTSPRLRSPIPIIFQGTDANQPTVQFIVPNVGEGIQVLLGSDVIYEGKYVASGKWQIGPKSGAGVSQYLINTKSISTNSTRAENLRGEATFATAATVAVTFATAEPDANYYVAIGGRANETFWVTAQATGGFTINSSNASSTATVMWILIR